MTNLSLLSPRPGGNGKPRATLAPIPQCIDLAERFGRRYRVEFEESYSAQYGSHARVDDRWLKIIRCRAGHICPWGTSTLAAVTNKAGPIARKLAALPGAKLWQDGSDGATVLFDLAQFPQVAKLMHPCQRRAGSKKLRAHLAVVGAKTRFQHGVRSSGAARISTAMALPDLEAVRADAGLFGPCTVHERHAGNFGHGLVGGGGKQRMEVKSHG